MFFDHGLCYGLFNCGIYKIATKYQLVTNCGIYEEVTILQSLMFEVKKNPKQIDENT